MNDSNTALDGPQLVDLLVRNGFIAAEEEARELLECAAGDASVLETLVSRRLTGEPLAWITGRTRFCDISVAVEPGVYVPRWQSEQLTLSAVARLPEYGVAVDVCTGSGAIAKTLMAQRPRATVIACDIDPVAVACAKTNGVNALCGDLLDPLPSSLTGGVDVVIGVVPYVPTPELVLLQRDTFTFESPLAYDGGNDGTEFLRRVIADSARFLRSGGALLLELGGNQAALLGEHLERLGYRDIAVLRDEDGDVRGLEATSSSAGDDHT